MKKGVIFLLAVLIFGYEIEIINGIKEKFDLKELDKYAYTAYIKPSFENKKHKYQFVFLSKIKDLFCPFYKTLVFETVDNETVSFSLKEIIQKNIVFAYKIDGKEILTKDKGPIQIIYLHNKNPLKEIYMVNKIICK